MHVIYNMYKLQKHCLKCGKLISIILHSKMHFICLNSCDLVHRELYFLKNYIMPWQILFHIILLDIYVDLSLSSLWLQINHQVICQNEPFP